MWMYTHTHCLGSSSLNNSGLFYLDISVRTILFIYTIVQTDLRGQHRGDILGYIPLTGQRYITSGDQILIYDITSLTTSFEFDGISPTVGVTMNIYQIADLMVRMNKNICPSDGKL